MEKFKTAERKHASTWNLGSENAKLCLLWWGQASSNAKKGPGILVKADSLHAPSTLLCNEEFDWLLSLFPSE